MIAQLLLTALLLFFLLYASTKRAQAPAVAFAALLTGAAGLYFVWLPGHATVLAQLAGSGRGVDLTLYVWVAISLILLLDVNLKLRAQMELITALARALALAEARANPGK